MGWVWAHGIRKGCMAWQGINDAGSIHFQATVKGVHVCGDNKRGSLLTNILKAVICADTGKAKRPTCARNATVPSPSSLGLNRPWGCGAPSALPPSPPTAPDGRQQCGGVRTPPPPAPPSAASPLARPPVNAAGAAAIAPGWLLTKKLSRMASS